MLAGIRQHGRPVEFIAGIERLHTQHMVGRLQFQRHHAFAQQIEDRVLVTLVEDDLALIEVHLPGQGGQQVDMLGWKFGNEGVLLQHGQQGR